MPSRLPKAQHWSRRTKWLLAVLALFAVGGTSLGGWYFYTRKHAARPDLLLQPIKKEKLQITITDRGSLEPADNSFISCKVKAKTPGQASTSIRWVIDNGAFVKEGDKILELDDSALQDQLTTQQIAVLNAEKTWKQADQQLVMNLITNEALVETQKTTLDVAKITLQEYLEGQYQTAKIDLENKRILSSSDLTMWQERASWSDRMSRPGRQFVTASQAESDEARRLTAELTKKNILKQLEVLNNLTREKNRIDFQGKIEEAERQVKKAQALLEKQRESDLVGVKTGEAVYEKELSKLRDIEKEIENCFIRAPRDGMVVYYVEERARFGQSGGVIAQGELVKEGQKMISVPDLTRMVVNARVHEAMVSRVIGDKERTTGFSEAVNTSLLFSPQPLCALSAYISFDTDLQTMFTNAHPYLEKKLERRGLDAVVRVNAFPDRALRAHVKWVSPVASQTDFFSSDVKVYQTYIAIDDDRLEGLKPGMDAVVTIKVDSTPEPVLCIPLQALLGSVDMGEKRRCFVMVDGHPEMREVTLGKANETHAEVKDGLNEGDTIVVNPAILLSDKERAEYGVQSSSSGRGDSEGAVGGDKGRGPGGKGKGKGKGKGPGGPPGMPGSPGGGFGGNGPRSQGGASGDGKTRANP